MQRLPLGEWVAFRIGRQAAAAEVVPGLVFGRQTATAARRPLCSAETRRRFQAATEAAHPKARCPLDDGGRGGGGGGGSGVYAQARLWDTTESVALDFARFYWGDQGAQCARACKAYLTQSELKRPLPKGCECFDLNILVVSTAVPLTIAFRVFQYSVVLPNFPTVGGAEAQMDFLKALLGEN
jgi:hypothetical protein